jgi:hypothetical protein
MLTLLTTNVFEVWFRALTDEVAEDVAAAIGLIETLGPARMAPGSSELLLWYQAPTARLPSMMRSLDQFGEFNSRMRRIVRHLESDSLRRRLAEVSSNRAQLAQAAIQSLIRRARWRPAYALDEKLRSDVEQHYRALLEALDLAEPNDEPANDALRQLDICQRRPGLRVLYGVDAARERGLLVLGESLDRCVYGPSVRKALSLWQEFLADGRDVAAGQNTARSSR